MSYREDARAIWEAGVDAVRPENCMAELFDDLPPSLESVWPLEQYERIHVVGGGKAGAAMSKTLEDLLQKQGIELNQVRGHVNVPNETVIPLKAIHLHPSRPSGLNQPTAEGLAGTEKILRIFSEAGPNDLVIALLSGGGSALMPAPVDGITLADKQKATHLLHECGATIQEMNTIRKHISKIKGGGLLRRFRGRRMMSLIISDVIGDPLDMIASGPTTADPTTFEDVWKILETYELEKRMPATVISHIQRGRLGLEMETVKETPIDAMGRPVCHNSIIANNAKALKAARKHAEALGYNVIDWGSRIHGETGVVAVNIADRVHLFSFDSHKESNRIMKGVMPKPLAFLFGGETTVTLKNPYGSGGRNQEFVLAFLNRLGRERMEGVTMLSGGTDGEDGPTDAAGAIADARTWADAEQRNLDPSVFLRNHDAYHFFAAVGGLLKTGPTNTNVMDLQVIIVTKTGAS